MTDQPTPIQFQAYLGGVDYPASRGDLVSAARANGAPEDVIRQLERLSEEVFDAPTAVSRAIADAA